MIIVITLLVYVAFGALVNTFLIGENFINALYFTVVTIETIGFGDITPKTTGAKVFTNVYMAFGILNVGLAVAMTRETVLEGLELGYRKRLRNLQLKRREARRFRRWEARWRRAVEWRLREEDAPVWVPDSRFPDEGIRFLGLEGQRDGAGQVHWFRRWLESIGVLKSRPASYRDPHVRGHPHGKHLNLDALTPQQLEAAALEAGVPLEMFLSPPREREIEREVERVTTTTSTVSSKRGDQRMFWYHRRPDTNGWPTYPQTPTHAQVGRMAAMITKFAMVVTGTHVHMLGHSPETHPSRQMEVEAIRDVQPNANRRESHDGAAESSGVTTQYGQQDRQKSRGKDEEKEARDKEGEHRGDRSEKPKHREDAQQKHDGNPPTPTGQLVVEGSLHPSVPGWAKDFAHGRNTTENIMYEHFKEDLETEESKAYWAKVCRACNVVSRDTS